MRALIKLLFILVICNLFLNIHSTTNLKLNKDKSKTYSDVEIEQLLHEWDENDEDVEEEDKFIHERNKISQPQSLDEMKLAAKNEEELLKLSKKNQQLMMFVTVKDLSNAVTSKLFTEKMTQIWQSNVYNKHISCKVFSIADDRAIFMFEDGSLAFDVREFLLEQPEIVEVTLEGKISKGLAASKDEL
uniref:Mesoderm development candidate 2 n=1 Tax=Rhabditophanes sp. KR3021 TaxID=114890 RepID=A0AC35U854_9BILA